jgi:glycosyltransferase involved in cell wall biosynthesis
MELLIVNFEMDRDSLSMPWSARIVDLLSERCDRIHVLTQRIGRYEPRSNVTLEAMPLARLLAIPGLRAAFFRVMRFRLRMLLARRRFDACFIHMAAYWAAVFEPEFRRAQVPVLVWYAHGSVTAELHRVVAAADRLVTSTADGLRLATSKLRIIGQGVDTDLFHLRSPGMARHDLVAVTRLSPRKRIGLLIDVMRRILDREPTTPIRLWIAGSTITRSEVAYRREIERRVRKAGLDDHVRLLGHLPQERLPELYRTAFLHLHVSETGSLDKTVLESLACGCPVLSTSEACRDLLASFPDLSAVGADAVMLAGRVLDLHRAPERFAAEKLRALVIGRHDDRHYVTEIMRHLDELTGTLS